MYYYRFNSVLTASGNATAMIILVGFPSAKRGTACKTCLLQSVLNLTVPIREG